MDLSPSDRVELTRDCLAQPTLTTVDGRTLIAELYLGHGTKAWLKYEAPLNSTPRGEITELYRE